MNKIQISDPVCIVKGNDFLGQEGIVTGQVSMDNSVTMPYYHVRLKEGEFTFREEHLEVLEDDF
jgi:hypothetical protein